MFPVLFVSGERRALPARVSSFGCCLLLAACSGVAASGPRGGAVAVPPDASSEARLADRTNELQPGRALERGAFVRAVLARNPSIEATRQALRAAQARVRQSGSLPDPMLQLGLAPLSVASSRAPLGYEAMLSQTLPWFGKRELDAAIASAEAEAAKGDVEAAQRELALTAWNLYGKYYVAYRSLEVNAEHVKLMQAMRDAVALQLASGRSSTEDALAAEAELTHMEHDSVILSFERDILIAQMNELLHRAPGEPLPPPAASLPSAAPLERQPAQLEAQALRERPEIAAAHERARAAQARAERAERDRYPDVTLSTSYNSMWDMPQHRWMLGLGLNLPIFSAKRGGMADEARAQQAEFQSDAARLSDAARTQVFVSLKQLQESEHVLRLFDTKLLPIAKQRIDAARAGFISGRTPFMSVIETEKNLRSVELEYQVARAEQAAREGELERALGKTPGLAPEEGRP